MVIVLVLLMMKTISACKVRSFFLSFQIFQTKSSFFIAFARVESRLTMGTGSFV